MQKMPLCLLLCCSAVTCAAAQSAVPGTNWDRLKALPAGTRMHVSGDRMTRTCTLDHVTDDELVCSKGRVVNSAHYTFSRQEVSSVKLTRYGVSTAAGLGIGAAAGAIIPAAVLKGGGFLDFKGAAVTIFSVAGGVAGALITGPTDAFRGPTVYRRTNP